ncbi:hypothetical protein ACFSKM_17250 [Ancylobacter dichloromethanicus]
MAPQLEAAHAGLGQIIFLVEIELDYAAADVGAADVNGKDVVEAGEHPARGEMGGADQPGLVGVVAYRPQFDVDAPGPCQQFRPRHRDLGESPGLQPAADDDTLGVAPFLAAQQPAKHGEKLAGIFLDGAVDDGLLMRLALGQRLVDYGFGEFGGRRLPEHRQLAVPEIAPAVEDFEEGGAPGAVADEAVLVANPGIEAVDRHGRQRRGAVDRHFGRRLPGLVFRAPGLRCALGHSCAFHSLSLHRVENE